jgi:CTP:molybdopterin cytidylyltransferase MocA
MSVACAVLAAGGSARLGRPKQLLASEGRSLIGHIVETATRARCEHVAVVIGAYAEQVESSLDGIRLRPVVLLNRAWRSGLASSIHVAVRWASECAAQALMLTTCDQPRLCAAHLERLRQLHAVEGRPVASGYGGTVGVPAIFPASCFAQLLELDGDRGAAPLLRGDPNTRVVPMEGGELDLDTEQDVARQRFTTPLARYWS